jgi:2-polyprenyl-3-methyl-5-hydroxy-6-metoxy-1,4-benzoquinol methylase
MMETPPRTDEEFLRWNEEMAIKYNPDAYHESPNLVIRWVERSRVKRILTFLHLRSTDRVLEVGVGAGNILSRVPVEERWGLDLSPTLLAIARRTLPDAHLIQGDAEQFPPELREQIFDRVFCSEVLEHVRHPDRVIREIASVLASDGIAVISVPNERFINKVKTLLLRLQLFSFFFPGLSKKMDDEWHLHTFDRALLQHVVGDALVFDQIHAVPFFWFPIRIVAQLRKPSSVQGSATR